MTTSDVQGAGTSPEHIDRLKENLEKVEHLSKRLVEVMASKKPHHPGLDGPNQELFARAATSYWASMLQNPAKLLEHQIEYWGKSVLNFAEAQQALAGQQDGEGDDAPSDRRFTNPMWDKNPYFRFIKQQYMTNAAAIREAVDEAGDLDRVDRQRLSYFADQIIHMMAPTNFLPTNPDAL